MNPEPIQWGATRAQPLGSPAAPVTGQLPTHQPTTVPPPRRGRTGLVVALVLASLILVGGGTVLAFALTHRGPAATSKAQTQTFTATGTVTVTGGCESIGGYGDITDGTQVVLTDGAGKTVSVGTLASTHSSTVCSYTWTLTGIPVGERFYGIAVARRGVLQITEGQLRTGVDIHIG